MTTPCSHLVQASSFQKSLSNSGKLLSLKTIIGHVTFGSQILNTSEVKRQMLRARINFQKWVFYQTLFLKDSAEFFLISANYNFHLFHVRVGDYFYL